MGAESEKPHYNSGAYLESLSDEQLNEQLRGSFPGGAAFEGASFELARRSGKQQERLIKWSLLLGAISILVGVIGLLA